MLRKIGGGGFLVSFFLLSFLACFLGGAAAFLAAAPLAFASTDVTADISTDTTWDEAGSPYVIRDTVMVGFGAALSILPNVVVKFEDGAALDVEGNLEALGDRKSVV